VFISASADRTLRVWDVRNRQGPMLTTKAHQQDVNVCSWNR
jgi:ribosome assembly protein RRB1